MKFKIKFTKLGNQFFFISNLTEWHFSCREGYNKIWLKQTGSLSGEEIQILKKMKKLLLKYSFGSKFLGIPFIAAPDTVVWKEVEKWVSEIEYNDLKKIFSTLKPRFERIWQNEKMKLAGWKNTLTKELAEQKYQNLEKNIEAFFSQKPQFHNIDVYLLISATGSGGGANIGPRRVTVECTALPAGQIQQVLGMLYHEVIHLAFEYGYYQNLLRRFLGSIENKFSEKHAFFGIGRGLGVIINEAVVSSLLPEGYLASKYFDRDVLRNAEKILGKNFENVTKDRKCDFGAYRLFVAAKLLPIVKDYIENKRPVDKEYLYLAWKVFEEFSKKII